MPRVHIPQPGLRLERESLAAREIRLGMVPHITSEVTSRPSRENQLRSPRMRLLLRSRSPAEKTVRLGSGLDAVLACELGRGEVGEERMVYEREADNDERLRGDMRAG